jgi:1,4-alpha-glucan branching enzyme
VVKSEKTTGAQTWAGTVAGDNGLTSPIPFTVTETKMSVRVWSPDAGTPVRLKVENTADGNINVETEDTTTVAGGWETLEFDFANHLGSALNLANTYDKVVIFFDFGTTGSGKTYYWDDVMMASPSSTPDSVDITFLVNSANITVDPTGLYLAGGGNFGVPGDNPMSDANNDGVYEITVRKPKGFSSFYIFTNGNSGWGAKEDLTGLPCADPNNFNDRFLPGVYSDTTLLTCYGTCAADTVCPAPPAMVDLTFTVDMSQYGTSFTTAYLFGTFNGWNGTANPMTDQGNGLWSTTITVNENDSLEYKFLADATAETFAGGESCTKTTGAFTNRFLAYGNMNITLDTVCWNSCAACPIATPDSVDITFLVNSANITVDPTGLFLAGGGNFGVPGDNPMSDANSDGVYEITVRKPKGFSSFYIFTNGNSGWGAKEDLTGLPCADPANFNDRFLPGVYSDTILLTCYETCATDTVCPAPPATVDLTFTVDMSQNGSFTTAYMFGNFNGWNGTANPMTDQGNGLWSTTITVNENDSIEYKFLADANAEVFAGGEPCTKTTGAFTNRFLAYGNMNMTLDTVCFNSCMACPPLPPDSVDVTFLVGTSNIVVDPGGLFLAGGGTFGIPGDNPMSDANGDGVWEITVRLQKGQSTDYTFTNGNCPNFSCKENISGLPCAVAPWDDRNFPGAWSDTTVLTCFGTCNTDTICPAPPGMIDITLSVDMSQYTGTFSSVNLFGSFNGWNNTANPMTDQGNGVWETTITVNENDSIEYKFVAVDGMTLTEETFAGGEPCTKTTGAFTNRFLVYGSSNVTVSTVCWESCMACMTGSQPDTVNVTFSVDMSQYGGSFTTVYVSGGFNSWGQFDNPLTDQGNGIWSTTMAIDTNSTYFWKFQVDGWTDQENFGPADACAANNNGNYDRLLTTGLVDMTLPTYCWSTCNTNCSAPIDSVDITFWVNTATITVDPTGIFLAGGGNFGVPGDNPMTDPDGDGVYEITVRRPKGFSSYYIFTNGNSGWGAKEDLTGLPCADPANFNDRFLPGVYSDTLLMTCYETCATDTICSAPPTMYDVTFQVDMQAQTVDPLGVFLAGSFEGWQKSIAMSDVNGDGVYEATVSLTTGDHEYKFVNGDWPTAEDFDPMTSDSICTITDPSGAFTNRLVSIAGDSTLYVYCYDSCYTCDGFNVNTTQVMIDENLFSIRPNITRDFTNLHFANYAISEEQVIRVYNAYGQLILNEIVNNTDIYRMDVSQLASGMYFVNVQSGNRIATKRLVIQR